MTRALPYLAWTTTALTLCLIVLGAYVRLADAGLGCPDWPGCYGELVVPSDAQALREAQARYPESQLDTGKAHIEMAHRYLAALVGLLVLGITILAYRVRSQWQLATALLLLVIFQALLGRWTVTLLLEPLVVVAHLLGGMTILCLLCWLSLGWSRPSAASTTALRPWLLAAGAMLIMQVTLGGWTSANYAGLSCPDFPTCRGSWWPSGAEFKQAFLPSFGTGDPRAGTLSDGAMLAIHLAHRLGAALTLLVLAAASLRVLRNGPPPLHRWAWLLFSLTIAQVGIGIANVLLRLPVPAAAAHNLLAALLLLTLTVLLYRSRPGPAPPITLAGS